MLNECVDHTKWKLTRIGNVSNFSLFTSLGSFSGLVLYTQRYSLQHFYFGFFIFCFLRVFAILSMKLTQHTQHRLYEHIEDSQQPFHFFLLLFFFCSHNFFGIFFLLYSAFARTSDIFFIIISCLHWMNHKQLGISAVFLFISGPVGRESLDGDLWWAAGGCGRWQIAIYEHNFDETSFHFVGLFFLRWCDSQFTWTLPILNVDLARRNYDFWFTFECTSRWGVLTYRETIFYMRNCNFSLFILANFFGLKFIRSRWLKFNTAKSLLLQFTLCDSPALKFGKPLKLNFFFVLN